MAAFHRTSNTTSPTRHTTHQDLDSENYFPSSLETQCNGYHFFLRRGGLIQVDIGGHPPVPNSNWLILTVFSSARFSVMGTFIFNSGFCTYEVAIMNPYTAFRWILLVSHLFQLDYFGIFHVSTYLCTSRVVLGL
jgi:hypothetical protein